VVANPNYYRASEGLPYLHSVVFRIVPNQDTILKDLQAGSIDSSWFLDVTKTIAYQHLSNYKLTSNPKSTNFEAMYLDFRNPILGSDAAVRKAMAMAIDHTALIDTARRGFASPLCTDHPAGVIPGYQADAACPKYDPAAANTLLDQAGWTTKDSNGTRHKGNQVLSFNYSTTANNLWRADDELILQQNFQAIGIKLNIQNYPASTLFGSFLTDAKPGVYDIVEYATSNTYDPDDAALFQCGVPSNTTYYCNPQLDAQYKAEQSSGVSSVRQQAFDKIHQIELTDFPFIVEFANPDIGIYRVGTHNYSPSLLGLGSTENVWEWWCDNGTCPAS